MCVSFHLYKEQFAQIIRSPITVFSLFSVDWMETEGSGVWAESAAVVLCFVLCYANVVLCRYCVMSMLCYADEDWREWGMGWSRSCCVMPAPIDAAADSTADCDRHSSSSLSTDLLRKQKTVLVG